MAMGRNIGVQIRMVAAMSMKVPSRNRNRLIRKKITQGLVDTAASMLPASSATSYSAIRYWNMVDTPISSSTTPVVLTALAAAFRNFVHVIVR